MKQVETKEERKEICKGGFLFTIIHKTIDFDFCKENHWFLRITPPNNHWIAKKLMKCKSPDDVDNIIHFSRTCCTFFDNEYLTFGTDYNVIEYDFMEDVDNFADAKPILREIERLCRYFKIA